MAKVSVDRKQLSEAVSAIATLCKPNSPKEILKYLHFTAHDGALEVFATNLEQGASRKIEADVIKDGKFLFEAMPLQKFLNLSGDETVHLTADKDSVVILSARSKLKNDTPKVGDYPVKFQPEGDLVFTAGASMRAAFKPISMASKGPEERTSRYAIDSFCLSIVGGAVWAVCTDGVKMATASIQAQPGDERTILIPIDALRLIESQWKPDDEVTVTISDKAIYFSSGYWLAYSLQVAGRYPQWQKVMPSGDSLFSATVDQQSFKRIIDTALIGAGGMEDRRAALSFTRESITASAGASPNECEASLPCSGKGECKLAINLGYTQTAVASFPSNMPIELSVINGILSLQNSSHRFIVMGLADERPKQSA